MASRTKSGTYDRTLGEGGFPGVDFSGMPGSVGPSHFADACNVWRDYDNGQGVCVETIPGFRALMRARGGPDPDHLTDLAVHGVYEYRLARHPYYSEGAGNYLLVRGDFRPSDIVELMRRTFSFVAGFDGEVPGAAPKDCGNYLLHDLPMARYEARKYLTEVLDVIKDENMNYPG